MNSYRIRRCISRFNASLFRLKTNLMWSMRFKMNDLYLKFHFLLLLLMWWNTRIKIWSENVDWEWNDFWKGFGVKKKYSLWSYRWLFYQNHVSLFRRYISVNIWHARMVDISKFLSKSLKIHLRNIHWIVQISVENTQKCISELNICFSLGATYLMYHK